MRSMLGNVIAAGVVLVPAMLWGSSARAAEPVTSPTEARGYVHLSPGVIGVPIGDDDLEEGLGVSYQWGLGGGGVIPIGGRGNMALNVGLNFEHLPLAPDGNLEDLCDTSGVDCSFQAFRLAPELRFGGGTRRLFAYGTVTPGLGIVHSDIEGSFGAGPLTLTFGGDDTELGFDFGFGGGVQYVVWRGLSIGGELGFDFGIYPGDDDDEEEFGFHTFELKALVGWWF